MTTVRWEAIHAKGDTRSATLPYHYWNGSQFANTWNLRVGRHPEKYIKALLTNWHSIMPKFPPSRRRVILHAISPQPKQSFLHLSYPDPSEKWAFYYIDGVRRRILAMELDTAPEIALNTAQLEVTRRHTVVICLRQQWQTYGWSDQANSAYVWVESKQWEQKSTA